jgi:hypothetical protein
MTEKYETYATTVPDGYMLTLYQNDGMKSPENAVCYVCKTTTDFKMMKEGAAKMLYPKANHKAVAINLYTKEGVSIPKAECVHDCMEIIVEVDGQECVTMRPFQVTLYHNDGTFSPERARKCTITQCPFDQLKTRMLQTLGLQGGTVQLYSTDGLPVLNIKSINEGMEIIVARDNNEVATRGFPVTLFRNDGLNCTETAKLCLVRHSNLNTIKEDMAKCLYPGSVAEMQARTINLFTIRGVPIEGGHFLKEGMDIIVAVNQSAAKKLIPVILYHNDGLRLGARARCCKVEAGDFNSMKVQMGKALRPDIPVQNADSIRVFMLDGAQVDHPLFIKDGIQLIVATTGQGLVPIVLPQQQGCCVVM